MSLIEHLKIRTPLVWVNTSEPNRYIDISLRFCPGDAYIMDPKNGFSIWDKADEKWKAILFEVENPATGEIVEMATSDLGTAINYVLDNPGTMIINFAHKFADDMAGLFAWAFSDYRTAFFEDDFDQLGPQFLLFSYGADIPQDLMHLLTVVNPALPKVEELAEITTHIVTSLGDKLDAEVDLSKVSKAGVGLNEPDFVKASLLSIREKRQLDPTYINEYKMERVRESCNLEIIRPKDGMETIGGLDNAKKLIRHIKWMWDNEEEAAAQDLEPLRRLLMVGVPGTGKSAIAKAAAATLGLDLAKTGVSQSLNKFIGQSEENMRNVFRQISALAPIVMWVDEFGRDVSQGNWSGDGGTTSRVHGEFLTGLQELDKNVLLIAAANQIGHVAPEMLRADRFDRILFVGFPTMEERIEIFKIHLGQNWSDFDVHALAEASSMFTGAEIRAIIRETRFLKSQDEIRKITTEHILEAMPTMKNRIWLRHRPEIKEMYHQALGNWDWASSSQRGEAEAILNSNSDSLTKGRSSFAGF